jgi:hypothetical protein
MDDPGRLDGGLGQQNGEHFAVGLHQLAHRQRGLHGPPGQLVPERDVLGSATEHAGPLGQPAGGRRQPADPGQDGVANRGRYGVAAGGQHLRDEERVTPGHPVDLGRVLIVHAGQRADRIDTQRPELHPARRCAAEPAQHPPQQWVRRVGFVIPEGQQDDGRDTADPPRQEADRVQRRVIGPMNVLQHEHRGCGPQEPEQSRQQGL